MHIRGTSNPVCKLCEYAFFDIEKNVYICKINDTETDANNQCKKFRYDIYKYQPRKKTNFAKFSKEDFEI